MDRFILFSDIHIHNHANDWRRVDDALQVLDWIKQQAQERDITKILFLGDFFHVRGYLYPSILAKSYDKLIQFRDAGLEMYMLVGNHDMPYKHTTEHNSLTALGSIVNLIEQPSVLEGHAWNFYWLPYIENIDKLRWAIGKVVEEKDGTKKSCFLGHLDIKGAKYHPFIEATSGIELTDVSQSFDIVLSGHYHTHQKLGDNTWYIGSPYQQSFGEAGEAKGIMLFDDGNVEFIENTFSPKYLYITPEQINDSIHGNYVSISTEDTSNIPDIRAMALKYEPRYVTIKVNRPTTEKQQLVSFKNDSRDISALLKEWIAKTANPAIYDHQKLFSYGMSIIEESKSL